MSMKMIGEHLFLVFASVSFTVLLGVPLGIWAYMAKPVKKVILGAVEILQTIPALALLGIIMVFLGAGKPTVIIGVVLYSLLPVVQNTYLGLSQVSPAIREVASGMGMTPGYRLLHVELPIAFPYVFSGIRIATVTSVGVAVFSTFVGGGGLGSAIYQSIRVNNMGLMLKATLSLMVMATLFDWVMAQIEKRLRTRQSPNTTQD